LRVIAAWLGGCTLVFGWRILPDLSNLCRWPVCR